jgi:hypothetical protein
MTLSRLSFMVFVDPYQGIYGVCLLSSLKICGIFDIRHSNIILCFSHLISNRSIWSSYVRDKESILANIYCIVRHMDPEGQVRPYSQIKMCICVILNMG